MPSQWDIYLCHVVVMVDNITVFRDIPLVPHTPSIPWPRIVNYLKKESSVVGQGCELSDKMTIQQCTLDQGIKIGAKSKLNNCVLMQGVVIGEK